MRLCVVVNALHSHPGGTGLARYSREMLRFLIPKLQEHFKVLVVATELYEGPEGDGLILAPLQVSPDRGGKAHILRVLWRQFVLPRKLKKNLVHAYYSPVPETSGLNCRQVVTVHDLIPLQYRAHHWKQFWLFWIELRLVAMRASSVVTISRETCRLWKDWAGERYQGKCTVIYNGIYVPGYRGKLSAPVGVESPYVLYVGDPRPYKGVDTLIEALARTGEPVTLKVAGNVSAENKARLENLSSQFGVSDRVVFCGYVDDHSLASLYREASAVGLASQSEGFGLVPLEGMLWGCPAIVSDIPVLQEILGNYAEYVPVGDIQGWARALDRAVREHEGRTEEQRRRLEEFARSFSWSETARQVAKVIYDETEIDTSVDGGGPGSG